MCLEGDSEWTDFHRQTVHTSCYCTTLLNHKETANLSYIFGFFCHLVQSVSVEKSLDKVKWMRKPTGFLSAILKSIVSKKLLYLDKKEKKLHGLDGQRDVMH